MIFAKSKSRLLLFAVGFVLWAVMTRPLVCHFSGAIPCSGLPFRLQPSKGIEVAELTPGDHVQLLYHFWLFRDMLAGKTPAFGNVYEFNTGDDGARRRIEPYYVPFSLVYALVSSIFGHEAGFNAAGLFAAMLGFFGFFALARRHLESPFAAGMIAVVVSAFPYRWVSVLGGSPTGYASALVPWLLYGLDRAVRDRDLSGGLVAGLALFFSYCSDLHVFFFSVLLTPFWCAICFLPQVFRHSPGGLRLPSLLRALSPLVFFLCLSIALSLAAGSGLAKSSMSGGRSINELFVFSPPLPSLFCWRYFGYSNFFFIGSGLVGFVAFGYIVFWLGVRGEKGREKRQAVCSMALLTMAVAAILMLAFGTSGPCNGLPIRAARKIVPMYRMIRQPVKIYCLLPPVLCVLLSVLYRRVTSVQAVLRGIAALLAAATVVEHALWMFPQLSVLPPRLRAYSAAMSFAETHGYKAPRAICLPIWPGDFHLSTIYEYEALLSRFRLVNGYAPAVPNAYNEVFPTLRRLNYGQLDADVIQLLRAIGINFVVFHDSSFFPPNLDAPVNIDVPFDKLLAELRGNPAFTEIAADQGVVVFALNP